MSDPALKFLVGGTLLLFLGTIHLGVGSLRSFQDVVGQTPWQIGTQTALAGGLGFFLIALVYHQLPKIIGRALYSVAWATRQFWMQAVGLVTVVLALSIAGLIQGHEQIAGLKSGSPISFGNKWFVITDAIKPLFILRIAGGALVAFGLFMFVAHLIRTVTMGEDAAVEPLPFGDAKAEPEAVGVPA